ncbi:MAG: YraN family protein [Verrucomicrobia bacterium]|nr:YraN family protein [Verrucomicrobiota bacterium]
MNRVESSGGLRAAVDFLKRLIAGKGSEDCRTEKAKTGEWGESVAEAMLRKKGYRILGRRLRVGTRDEIDLLARDGEVVVFVEVKTRKSEDFGRPLSSVDRRKRHALSRAAVRYLKKHHFPKVYFRFDVVEVVGAYRDGDARSVKHVENAFTLDRQYMLP